MRGGTSSIDWVRGSRVGQLEVEFDFEVQERLDGISVGHGRDAGKLEPFFAAHAGAKGAVGIVSLGERV